MANPESKEKIWLAVQAAVLASSGRKTETGGTKSSQSRLAMIRWVVPRFIPPPFNFSCACEVCISTVVNKSD